MISKETEGIGAGGGGWSVCLVAAHVQSMREGNVFTLSVHRRMPLLTGPWCPVLGLFPGGNPAHWSQVLAGAGGVPQSGLKFLGQGYPSCPGPGQRSPPARTRTGYPSPHSGSTCHRQDTAGAVHLLRFHAGVLSCNVNARSFLL